MVNLTIADLVVAAIANAAVQRIWASPATVRTTLATTSAAASQNRPSGRVEGQCALFGDKALDSLIARNMREPLYRPHRRPNSTEDEVGRE
jgi:hypothetical protein